MEINLPTGDSKNDYFSRKQRHRISIQAAVVVNLAFLDIATGYLGSTHNARILRDSSLYIQTERNIWLAEPTDAIDG